MIRVWSDSHDIHVLRIVCMWSHTCTHVHVHVCLVNNLSCGYTCSEELCMAHQGYWCRDYCCTCRLMFYCTIPHVYTIVIDSPWSNERAERNEHGTSQLGAHQSSEVSLSFSLSLSLFLSLPLSFPTDVCTYTHTPHSAHSPCMLKILFSFYVHVVCEFSICYHFSMLMFCLYSQTAAQNSSVCQREYPIP